MAELKLEINDGRTTFAPGDRVEGVAGWQLDKPVKSAKLHLLWSTSGKGTEDVGVAETVTFDDPPQVDARIFAFTVPDGPYSFSGRLISLTWSLELTVEPGTHVQRMDLVVSPHQQEVKL